MDHQLYILGIAASPRRGGNTEIIMDHVIQGAKSHGVITEVINLRTMRIKQCTVCEGCRTARICRAHRDDMQLIYSKIKAAKGLVLGSPTHSYNVSAKMKVFLDRLYPFYYFNPENRHDWHSLLPENKKAVIFSVCEQPGRKNLGVVMDAMRLPLQALGYEIVSEFAAFGLSKKGAVLKDQEQLKTAFAAGEKLAKSILT
ncbi:MAG: flavodoxin family protein [Desulfotomaculum sp.]|nr:flavodoxin family protein [Desulfotomaculum sp.]